MKFNGHFLLVIAAGMLAILVGWFYQAQVREFREPSVALEIPDNIDYYFTDLTYRVMKNNGETDYTFSSPRLEHQPGDDTSLIQTPAVTIHGQDSLWQVSAEQGQLYHQTEELHLDRQVVMEKKGTGSMRLESEKAVFEAANETVSFPAEVLITSAEAQISARSGYLDIKNNVFRFKHTRTVYRDDAS